MCFETFSIYSGFKADTSKCKTAGIGVLKRVSVELKMKRTLLRLLKKLRMFSKFGE